MLLLLLPFQKGICFCFKSHDYYYAECNKTVNSVKRSWRNYMARKATLLSCECKIQQTVTVFLEISGVCFHAFNVLIVFSGVTMSSYSHLLGTYTWTQNLSYPYCSNILLRECKKFWAQVYFRMREERLFLSVGFLACVHLSWNDVNLK